MTYNVSSGTLNTRSMPVLVMNVNEMTEYCQLVFTCDRKRLTVTSTSVAGIFCFCIFLIALDILHRFIVLLLLCSRS